MRAIDDPEAETYNPWTVVHTVFAQLASEGLHPVLGDGGDPAEPARALLVALGIHPRAEGNREVMRKVHEHLAEIRTVVFDDDLDDDEAGSSGAGPGVSL